MGIFQNLEQKDSLFSPPEGSAPTISHGGISLSAAFNDPAGRFVTGALKGVGSTLKGMGTIGQTVLDQTAGRAVNALQGKGFTPTGPTPGDTGNLYRRGTSEEQSATAALQPNGLAENLGFGAEQLAEFLAPASAAAKGEAIVNTLSKGITSPAAAATARIAGKSAIQGLAAGAVKFLQTGGDIKAAKDTALLAGAARGTFATIGEGARAVRLPERLYSTIFKNTASDMMQELRTENLVNLKQTNPEKYAQFLKQGIVSETKGAPVLNETLAKQALDIGLRGNIRNMARTVINGALESESQVRSVIASHADPIDLSESQFYNVLKGIQRDYEDVGFNEISDDAARLAQALKDTSGHVSAVQALDIRRLLDRARIASSFEKPASSLSLTQSNLKTLADAARSRVNAIPGVGEIMQKYSFYLEAIETLAKEAARRGNNQALSLIDSLFLSSSFGSDAPYLGPVASIFRRYIMSGPGTTGLAQMFNRGTAAPLTIGATSAAASGLESQLAPQQ